MDLKIRQLDKDTVADFFTFFDNIAFCDHEEWSWCYCTFYHFDASKELEVMFHTKNDVRDKALELINNGTMKGYLAYVDDKVIGWCNANNKTNYMLISSNSDLLTDEQSKPNQLYVLSLLLKCVKRELLLRYFKEYVMMPK